MREFSRNYEGYPDPTVYSAITNQGCKANWKEGTVFKMPNYNDTESYRVILKVYDTYVTSLMLFKTGREDNDKIEVNGETMYLDLGKIGYTQARNLNIADTVAVLDDAAYLDLIKRVAVHLGVRVADDFDEQWAVLVECQKENEELRKDNEALRAELKEAKEKSIERFKKSLVLSTVAQPENNSETYSVVVAERDLYKKLYDGLIEKLTCRITMKDAV